MYVDLRKIVLFGILIMDGRTVLKCILRKYCYSSGIGCSYQNSFRYRKFRHFEYKLIDRYRLKKSLSEVFDFEILCPELLKALLTLLAPSLTILYIGQVCHKKYKHIRQRSVII